jgi:hypothetical protein
LSSAHCCSTENQEREVGGRLVLKNPQEDRGDFPPQISLRGFSGTKSFYERKKIIKTKTN